MLIFGPGDQAEGCFGSVASHGGLAMGIEVSSRPSGF